MQRRHDRRPLGDGLGRGKAARVVLQPFGTEQLFTHGCEVAPYGRALLTAEDVTEN